MHPQHGAFIWYELLTTDVAAAARFYEAVVGWRTEPFPGGNGDYTVANASGAGVAGLMTNPMSTPPVWMGYIGVTDVDQSVVQAKDLGATVHVEPQDIPGVGRFAMIEDPQGVHIYLMRGASPDPSRAFEPASTGHCSWNELMTSDPIAGMGFYTEMFGWKPQGAMPMGELGDYSFFSWGDDRACGAIMGQMPGAPAAWTFYFRVTGIDDAAERVRANGGTVINGPMEVPGGDWIINATDPQGATFALVGPK